jgi:hypothetical protein
MTGQDTARDGTETYTECKGPQIGLGLSLRTLLQFPARFVCSEVQTKSLPPAVTFYMYDF